MEFYSVVRRRRMVRRYAPDPVDGRRIERILDAARRSPSAGFSQGQSFVVVTDPGRRQAIARIAREPRYVARGFEPWLSQAPVHILVCVSPQAYHRRYREPDKLGSAGEREWPVPYWYVDGGAALMVLLLAATDEGLGAGLLDLGREGYLRVKRLLGIPEEVEPIGLVTIGTPAPDRRSGSLDRGRLPRDQVVHREGW